MIARPVSQFFLLFGLLFMTVANCCAGVADVILLTAIQNPIDELETREVQNLYKGRLSTIRGTQLKPLNASPGSVDRNEFLSRVMEMNELDYTGYWHVRRYSGQGTPPNEVSDTSELFERLKQNPYRVGYLSVPSGSKPKLPDGLKIIKLK